MQMKLRVAQSFYVLIGKGDWLNEGLKLKLLGEFDIAQPTAKKGFLK